MTLTGRTIGLVGLTLLGLLALLVVASELVVRRGFVELQNLRTVQDLERAGAVLRDETSSLAEKIGDWGAWDDAYAFMESPGAPFISANLNAESLATLRLDAIFFRARDGRVVWSGALDARRNAVVPPPADLARIFADPAPAAPLSDSRTTSGFISLDGRVAMFAAHPVTRSDGTGPVRGSVVFVREVDESTARRIERLTLCRAALARPDDPSMPRDFVAALASMHQGTPTPVLPLSDSVLAAYAPIPDATGRPALVLRVETGRLVEARGNHAVSYFYVTLVMSGLCFGGVVVLLLRRAVLTRVARLSAEIVSVGRDGSPSRRVTVAGDDELATLSAEINRTLDSLERTHRELAAAREAAEAASRAKGDFLANMSHELRTPLTAILGHAELLADTRPDGPRHAESARTIRRCGEHLLAIISDVLDLSKIEAGAMTVEVIECRPHEVVADVVAMLADRAGAKGLTLSARCEPPLPATVRTDPTRLRQILVNLVGNAIKFTPRGGITLTMSFTPGRPELRFDVTDSGVGIEPAALGHIFQPFTQADTSTTRRYGGTGLGLAISLRLARLLGGGIDVRSAPGRGSTFSLRIATGPLEGVPLTGPAPVAPDTGGDPRRPLDGVRVLLAEDGPDMQRLVRHVLSAAGSAVDVVSDGRQAVIAVDAAAAAGRPYALVLMDMQMPEMDGYSAAAELRRRAHTLPVIALTAHALAEDRQRCLDAGCDEFLTKPVARETLIATCAALARSGRTDRRAA